MKLAYLMNTYPVTSATFIRREIHAIEATGVPVKRFAVRCWDEPLVDPLDQQESAQTEYLLSGNVAGLCLALVVQFLVAPIRLIRVVPVVAAMFRASGPGSGSALGNIARHIGYVMQAAYLRRRAKALGITHIHAHYLNNPTTVAMLCHLLGGPEYSFTVHGPDELIDPRSQSIAVKIMHAASVVAITAYCRDQLRRYVVPACDDRIHIMPCGLNLADFPDAANGPSEGDHLVCVGRLCEAKGQVHIPEAVAVLKDRFPHLRVLLIGDGETRPAIEAAIARLGLGEMITLAGWQSNAFVRDALRSSRALLLPSYAEGLPIVIMEAFALRRPVLTTRIAGIPELVDDQCGWLFAPGDQAGLIAAIEGVMGTAPDALAMMGAEGRRRIEARHDLATIGPALVALYSG